MLASQAGAGGEGMPELFSPTKRSSVLKKTFKVIGKVGKVTPKFKSKSKKSEMELMNSCASFDFEASDRSGEEEEDDLQEEDLDAELTGDEEEGDRVDDHDVEKSPQKVPSSKRSPSATLRSSSRASSDDEDENMTPSAESTPTAKKTPKLQAPSMMNLAPQLDIPELPASEHGMSTPKQSKYSRKRVTGKKSPSPRSPAPSKSSGSQSKRPEQPAPAPDLKSLPPARSPKKEAPPSPERRTESPEKQSSPDSARNKQEMISTKSLIQGLPQHLPTSIPEEVEDEDDEDNDESLKRLSRVFGDDSAMGGYFAKLQDLKHKDPSKPHSYSTSTEKTTDASKPKSTHDLGKSADEKTSRSFMPSKNIKKLFSMKRHSSNPKDEEKTKNSAKRNSEPQSKDEAAKLMLELSKLAMNNGGVNRDERPMKAHTTRPTRTFVFDEAEDDESQQEFPEIPTAKKTSLSDIRRMLDSSKPDPTAKEASLGEKHPRRSSIEQGRPSSSKSFHDRSRRKSSMDDVKVQVEETDNSPSPRKPLKTEHSPTSVTDALDGETADEIGEDKVKPPSPPVPEEKLLSPGGSRRGRGRTVKMAASDSSDGSSRRQSTARGESEDSKESEESLQLKASSSSSSQSSRRRGTRSATPVQDTIQEEYEEDVEPQADKDPSVSPGSLRRKKVEHRRHGDIRRSSTSGSSQSNRSVSPSAEHRSRGRTKSPDPSDEALPETDEKHGAEKNDDSKRVGHRRHGDSRRSSTNGASQSKRSVSPSEEYRSRGRAKSPDPSDEALSEMDEKHGAEKNDHSKRVGHRRHGDIRRSSTSGSSQSKRSVSPSEEHRSRGRTKSPDPSDEPLTETDKKQGSEKNDDSKRVPHRRHGDIRRSSTSGSSQSKRSVSPSEEHRSRGRTKSPDPSDEPLPETDEKQRSEKNDESTKDGGHSPRRPRRIDSNMRNLRRSTGDIDPTDDAPGETEGNQGATKNEDSANDNGHSLRRPRRLDSNTRNLRKSTGDIDERPKTEKASSSRNLGRPPLDASGTSSRRHNRRIERGSSESHIRRTESPVSVEAAKEKVEPPSKEKAKNPSLAESLEKGNLMKFAANDGQYSVTESIDSEMFVNGKMMYSKIRSDESVGAPQLIIGQNDGNERDLRVKNV